MNNCFKGILAACLIAGPILADEDFGGTNKTFQSPRPFGTFDLARQYTGIWNMIHQPKEEGKFGGFLNVTAGYNASNNGDDTGRYFGYECKNCFTVGSCGGSCPSTDIHRAHFIHRSTNPGTGDLKGNFSLNFEKKRWVVQFDYYQNLDFLWKGLHLTVKLPIVHEKSEACLNACNNPKQTICCGDTTREVGIEDYFKGCISQTCNTSCYDDTDMGGMDGSGNFINDTQCALSRMKIDSCSHSETGVGDIDVQLGYDCLRGEDYVLGFNVALTIPTGNTPKSCYAYEPVVGNGGGVGLGAGFFADYSFWNGENSSLQAHTVFDYRYFFKNSECRTVGHKQKKWAHYMLVGTLGQPGVQPFANVFTRSFDVTRGSHVNSLMGLTYNYGNFAFDLGYELFAREQESVKFKCNDKFECCYGFAGCDYISCENFTKGDIAGCGHNIACCAEKVSTGNGASANEGTPFSKCDIDTSVAETPAFTNHKLYGGVSYALNKWEYPILVRFGGYYEFASKKSPETWSVFGGAGIGF